MFVCCVEKGLTCVIKEVEAVSALFPAKPEEMSLAPKG